MRKDLRNRVFVIIAVIAASLYYTFPLEKHINLGLDLKGGMHVILQVDTSELSENAKKDVVPRAIEILRNRIDSLGVAEPIIQQQGDKQILVQLPGVTDRDTALRVMGDVAQLEFRLVSDDADKLTQATGGTVPKGFDLRYTKDDNEAVLLEDKAALTGEIIADASVDFNQLNQPYITLDFTSKGSKEFGKFTQKNIGRRLAIVLDGTVLSAPTIQDAIWGNGQISGRFSFDEASLLSLALRSGALPAPMHIEEERTIGPLLGKDSIEAGIRAAIIGGVLVIIFMLIYYLSAGIVSSIALIINLLILFGMMGLLNALMPNQPLTLTLPGIAGIILTLGMAVDANVLINERIREEIDGGRPLRTAINNGFNKALKAIIDSNTTTLIAAFMLFQFGSGPIKGFAVTLSIGLLVSLFTALFITRTLFNVLLEFKILKKLPMLRILHNVKIDFVSKRFICYIISIVLIVASIFTLVQKKEKAYGIDFVGGQIQEFQFQTPIKSDALREVLKIVGEEDAVIQQFDQFPGNVIIRTAKRKAEAHNILVNALNETFPNNPHEVLRIESVGPVVGKALQMAAIYAIVFALGGIMIYVGFRFRHFDFAAAGIIALLHDVFITLGILVMLNRQIDLLVVTALLTIAGYSINDTIIIYDRLRENLLSSKKQKLSDVINLSINQTLSRTILTTITTLLVVVTLFLIGGEVLNTFALCLMIGFIAGTYSTIFIASPLVLAWEKKKK